MDLTSIIISAICSIIAAVLSSSVVGTIVEYKLSKKDALNENDKNQNAGIRLILLSVLKRQGKDMIKVGTMTNNDWNEFKDSYDIYKDLGGDGYADMIYEEVKKLPKKELL